MKTGMKILTWMAIGLFVLAGCNSGNNNNGTTAKNKRDTVIIKMMAFNPDSLIVNKGDTIVWINQDIVAHDVSHFPDRSWHSDTLQPQDSFEKIITDSSGYFCSIHPTMKGWFGVK